jgi:hypothetical protein
MGFMMGRTGTVSNRQGGYEQEVLHMGITFGVPRLRGLESQANKSRPRRSRRKGGNPNKAT